MNTALEQDRREKTDIRRQMPDDGPEKIADRAGDTQDEDVAVETEPSDDAIIERIRDGDMNAFELLARRYERWVCGIVSRRVARDQAPDVMQEVFIHVYRSLPHYSPQSRLDLRRLVRHSSLNDGGSPGHVTPSTDGSFRHWLARIAVRCCCDYQRAAHRHPTCAVSNLSADDSQQMERTTQATVCETFHAEMELDATREALLQAMDGLDADDRIVLGLIYVMGYSLPEAADILGDSLGAVKSRAWRARGALRSRMSQMVNHESSVAAAPAVVLSIA